MKSKPYAILAGCALAIALAGGAAAKPQPAVHFAGAAPTPIFMTLMGWVNVNATPATAGVEVAVYDPQGTLCGVSGADVANRGAFLLHVYGDDPTTPDVDEGARAGDTLTFQVFDPATGQTVTLDPAAFSSAGLTDPPAYPPVFEEKGRYGFVIDARHGS